MRFWFAISSTRILFSCFLNFGLDSAQLLEGSPCMNLGSISFTISFSQLFLSCGMLYLMNSTLKRSYLKNLSILKLGSKTSTLESTDSGAGSSTALVRHSQFKLSPSALWKVPIRSMTTKDSRAPCGSQVRTFMAWLLSWQTLRYGAQLATTPYTRI